MKFSVYFGGRSLEYLRAFIVALINIKEFQSKIPCLSHINKSKSIKLSKLN